MAVLSSGLSSYLGLLCELPKMFSITLVHSTTFMTPHSSLKMPAS